MSITVDDSTTDSAGPHRRPEPLTALIVDRLLLADDVAAAKFLTGAPIDDPAREQQILKHVRSRAGAVGLDPDTATTLLRDQFAASKVVQRGLFSRWTAHPEEAPTARPDLGRVRERLDLLTTRLLRELKDPGPPRDEVERAGTPVRTDGCGPEPLDALHRRALDVATRSVRRTTEPIPRGVPCAPPPYSPRSSTTTLRQGDVVARRTPGL